MFLLEWVRCLYPIVFMILTIHQRGGTYFTSRHLRQASGFQSHVRIGLIVYTLLTFDVNLTQINPNVWKTLLCVSIITGELGIELNDKKTKAMYYLKKNDLDKERTYISVISGGELILKLPTSRGRQKNKYLYVISDNWGDEVEFSIRSTWNHNFVTTQPRGNELLNSLET